MKLVNYTKFYTSDIGSTIMGAVIDNKVVDLEFEGEGLDGFIRSIPFPFHSADGQLLYHTDLLKRYTALLQEVEAGKYANSSFKGITHQRVMNLSDAVIDRPLRRPLTLRDFYAFEHHVVTANANRGRDVPKEWYEFPVFYFSNVTAIKGTNEIIFCPSYSEALDYELEVACVIGKPGRDIPADEAEDHIFGYMIFNDWSARDVQKLEMRVGLGPAKGKDFANSFGPYLVTPDELADRHTGRPGVYDLEMVARVNGVEKSRGNWKDLYWSFGQMIERASQDVTLQPGDVIGSGTVGTGCLLELTKGDGPWLQPGDVVELEIERLGILRNIVGEKKPNRQDAENAKS